MKDDDFADRVASSLRQARAKTGLSQRAVAEALGIAQPQVSQYENGARTPRSKTLAAFAQVYDTSPSELLGGEPIDARLAALETRVASLEARLRQVKGVAGGDD